MKVLVVTLLFFLSITLAAQSPREDTIISKAEFILLKHQKDLVYEKSLIIYDFKKLLIKNRDEISILNDKIKNFTDKVTKHNLRLKKSQNKYKIQIN